MNQNTYNFTQPDHIAAYLRTLPSNQVKLHSDRLLKMKDGDFIDSVRQHYKDRTPIKSAKIPNKKDGAKFDGADYNPALDDNRINKQLGRVWQALSSGQWMTLDELETATNDPQASISAQLRHLRKERFGSHDIQRQRRTTGTWEYRLNTGERDGKRN